MNNYKLLSGETVQYADPPPAVADFLARVREAANDPMVSLDALISLIYGEENPILDTTILPGRAMVTSKAFDDPIYRVLKDQIGLKRVQLGLLDLNAARKAHSLSVNDVAKELGITASAVRAAVAARKLAAMYENGQWWIRPESVASYRVSNRGPKQKGRNAPKRRTAKLSARKR